MSSKMDRQGARSPADLEYRYYFGKTFAEVMGIAIDARDKAEQAQSAYNGLNSDEIFNRLTNNGEWEGLYEADGNIYINASYIKTGIIKSSNLATNTDGEVTRGMAIDLDNGIINSPKFKLNNLGEITATGGFLGEFEITEDGLSKVTSYAYDDRGIFTDNITINPSIITMASTFESAEGEQDNSSTKTSIQAGRLNIEETHGGNDFYGTLFSYTENGNLYSIYIDQEGGTVKAKLLATGL